jgi:hypothetical protein
MSKVSLRRLLTRLTALALSTSAVGAAAAEPPRGEPRLDVDVDNALDASVLIDRGSLEPREAGAALGRKLAMALGQLRPLSATHLATTWSLSEEPLRRLAVAHALEWPFALVGDALVIDHLSRDADPVIRAASARAAWARRLSGGDPGVLARLSQDPDPEVRAIAASARSG